MKRTCAAFAIFVAGCIWITSASAQTSTQSNWDSIYSPVNLSIFASGGFGLDISVGAYAGFELMYGELSVDDEIPFNFGILLAGMYNWFSRTVDDSELGWDVYAGGLLATMHLSFNNLTAHSTPFLDNFDL